MAEAYSLSSSDNFQNLYHPKSPTISMGLPDVPDKPSTDPICQESSGVPEEIMIKLNFSI